MHTQLNAQQESVNQLVNSRLNKFNAKSKKHQKISRFSFVGIKRHNPNHEYFSNYLWKFRVTTVNPTNDKNSQPEEVVEEFSLKLFDGYLGGNVHSMYLSKDWLEIDIKKGLSWSFLKVSDEGSKVLCQIITKFILEMQRVRSDMDAGSNKPISTAKFAKCIQPFEYTMNSQA